MIEVRNAHQPSSQRAYRERKVNHARGLEDRINYLKVRISALHDENEQLEIEISRLRAQNNDLHKSMFARLRARPSSPVKQTVHEMSWQGEPILLKNVLMFHGG